MAPGLKSFLRFNNKPDDDNYELTKLELYKPIYIYMNYSIKAKNEKFFLLVFILAAAQIWKPLQSSSWYNMSFSASLYSKLQAVKWRNGIFNKNPVTNNIHIYKSLCFLKFLKYSVIVFTLAFLHGSKCEKVIPISNPTCSVSISAKILLSHCILTQVK